MNPRCSKLLVSIVLLAVLVLSALALVPSTRAQDDPEWDVLIYIPMPSESYTATVGDTIWIFSEWWVCHASGLVTSFENAWAVELKVDGETVLDGSVKASKPYWGPVQSSDEPNEMCSGHPGTTYGSYWIYDLSSLDLGVGEHLIEWQTTQKHQVTDLFDWDEDGQPDKYPGGIVDDASATLIVTAE